MKVTKMIKQIVFVAALFSAPLAHATDFIVTIADPSQLAGITYARTQYNATLPKDDKGNVVGALATDANYVFWVVRQAAASFCSSVYESNRWTRGNRMSSAIIDDYGSSGRYGCCECPPSRIPYPEV